MTAAVMHIDADPAARAVAVVAGYGFTAAEVDAAPPPRLRPAVGTEPFAGWARRGDLVLAVHPTTGRTEVAQLAGKDAARDSATVHFADLRWTHVRLSNIAAPLPEESR
jgi:hypothetical protein